MLLKNMAVSFNTDYKFSFIKEINSVGKSVHVIYLWGKKVKKEVSSMTKVRIAASAKL